jgi:hypothetical protein
MAAMVSHAGTCCLGINCDAAAVANPELLMTCGRGAGTRWRQPYMGHLITGSGESMECPAAAQNLFHPRRQARGVPESRVVHS